MTYMTQTAPLSGTSLFSAIARLVKKHLSNTASPSCNAEIGSSVPAPSARHRPDATRRRAGQSRGLYTQCQSGFGATGAAAVPQLVR